jgi:hypothetical protein
MLWFRQTDPRWPFLWETAAQPSGRWHGYGEGPVQYLADTPDGAWAEFLRHEEITAAAALRGVERDVWAVEVGDDDLGEPALPSLDAGVARGGIETYAACQAEARRVRRRGAVALTSPSAALLPGAARGQRVEGGGLGEAPRRDGWVLVLFGARASLRGWRCVRRGRPDARLLGLVHHL